MGKQHWWNHLNSLKLFQCFPGPPSPGNKPENSWYFVLNTVSCDWEGYTRVYLSRRILSLIFPPRLHNKTDCLTTHTCKRSHSDVVLSLTALQALGSTHSDSCVVLTKLGGDTPHYAGNLSNRCLFSLGYYSLHEILPGTSLLYLCG